MSTATDFGVRSEKRSGHWVSWLTSGNTTEAAGAVLLVGQTQDEAEANAHRWAARVAEDPRLSWD